MNVMNNTEIFSLEIDEIKQLIEENKILVSVIGIGRIGLPTALSFAKSGFTTIGVDVNEELVDKIKNKNFPLKDEPGYEDVFNQVIENQKFTATTRIKDAVPNSQIILLSLPTPMDENNTPDYSALRIVARQLKDLVSPGSIIIVESTIEPGFIENECIDLIESQERNIKAGNNIGIGVCPETANPGEIMKDFEKLPRLVGSTDEKTTQIIQKLTQNSKVLKKLNMLGQLNFLAIKLELSKLLKL